MDIFAEQLTTDLIVDQQHDLPPEFVPPSMLVRWTPLAGQVKGQCKIVDCPFVPLISLGSSCPNCAGCQRLIPTAPVTIFRQSIATFNSPGKSRSVNPTGLIQLLLPATLYITSETGSVEYA